MGLLKLVVFAALLGCSQAFVAPASSLVVRSRADAVSAQMLFGAKKPVAKKGKKVQHAQPQQQPHDQPFSISALTDTCNPVSQHARP